MHAKLVTIEGQQAEGMEAAIIQFRERSLKAMRGEPGWQGAYLLVDRQTGKGVAVTLWDTLEDLEATERRATNFRQTAARTSGAEQPAKLQVYEVAVQELP